ncbi:MAG TPA: formate/nitrite transporter family protein [Actinomycetota bacterium]|nr:formate/nitrite transporter family protein [Actinomycetota bacterium]
MATTKRRTAEGPPPGERRSRASTGGPEKEPEEPEEREKEGEEEPQLNSAFERTITEGTHRLTRTWPGLLATGAVGGIDVSAGLLGLLLVEQATGNALLAALAFGIGFVALTLAGSELFTENFLVPIVAVAAGRSNLRSLARLWFGTAATNLLAGWVMAWIIVTAEPKLKPTAIKVAEVYPKLGIGLHSFALAVLGGVVITLMTWMERSTVSVPGKIVAAMSAAFLLAAGALDHAIIVSLEMFAALHAGAPFGYLVWFKVMLWAAFCNMLGGVGLVTVLRLVQVGRRKIQEEEDKAAAGEPV